MWLVLLPVDGMAQEVSLPVVKLWCESASATFSDGRFLLLLNGDTLIDSNADLRHRGASSLRYDKKSFAVKLRDSAGKRNESLLGMRSDNYWILDAAAIDMSRMRNRVAMDLWIAFSRQPDSFCTTNAIANGTHGEYVELFLNDCYEGLYCLSERLDRKQLGLRKLLPDNEIRGCMAKAVKWNTNTCFSSRINSIADDLQTLWGGFEAKYPDLEDGEPWSWLPFTSLLSFVENSMTSVLSEQVDELVDMPVMIDYVLLMYLIEGADNVAKNYYLSNADSSDDVCKWFITPWDMDHSFGRRYDGMMQAPEVVDVSLLSNNVLLRRIYSGSYNLRKKLCERYAELRAEEFSLDYLTALFNRYAEAFAVSGAWQREQERWSGNAVCPPPLAEEVQYISDWLAARLVVMDEFFDYTPELSVGNVAIENRALRYYTLQGIAVEQGRLRPGSLYICSDGSLSRIVMMP